ncbi:MAG: molecular chaperone DnaJ [Acidobacteria bacterium]|nr:molecular chaperone DnaJ [Acidobacteriota bacterium]
MTEKDYYAILGVPRHASEPEIKKAYRRKAIEYHPDKNPGDPDAEEKFKAAAEAYSVLGDPEKRARYDRFGAAGLGSGGFRGFDADLFADFEDILGDFFGLGGLFGGRRRPRPAVRRGSDLRYDLEIDFEEAVLGAETQIHVARLEACPDCRGSGGASPGSLVSCPDCGGRGAVHLRQGFFTLSRTCARCQGSGQFLRDPCRACRGTGHVQAEKTIRVKIPAGVDTGSRLRLAGEGEGGVRGGPPGDLYVSVRVRSHRFFERQGSDLSCRFPVTFSQAALGTTVAIPTLRGEESLRIPEGTQSGAVFRVRGRGVPEIGFDRRGVLYVTTQVVTPRKLSRRVRKILEELAGEEETFSGSPKDILERVRNLFP